MIRPASHSARVTLEFRSGSTRVPLAQLALDFAIAAEPIELPPCSGEILMTVDGAETRMPVRLPDGIGTAQRRFVLEPCSSYQ